MERVVKSPVLLSAGRAHRKPDAYSRVVIRGPADKAQVVPRAVHAAPLGNQVNHPDQIMLRRFYGVLLPPVSCVGGHDNVRV